MYVYLFSVSYLYSLSFGVPVCNGLTQKRAIYVDIYSFSAWRVETKSWRVETVTPQLRPNTQPPAIRCISTHYALYYAELHFPRFHTQNIKKARFPRCLYLYMKRNVRHSVFLQNRPIPCYTAISHPFPSLFPTPSI